MGNRIILEGGNDSPEVLYSDDNCTLSISGVCMPENAVEMFLPIFNGINELNTNNLILTLNLQYLNSMSSKQLLRLLMTIIDKFQELKIVWNFEEGDMLMQMKGEELKEVLQIEKFEIIAL